MKVDFYWDIGSTNTYFALKLIQPIVERHSAELNLIPFNLGYVFRSNNSILMNEPTAKLSNRRRDLMRWAEKHELPFRMPDKFPIKTSRVLRSALVIRESGLGLRYVEALFKAYWEDNDVGIENYEGLVPIASSLGMDGVELIERSESEQIRAQLIDSTNTGIQRGVFGVPSIFVGDELYWGKDRMEFIEEALANSSLDVTN